MTPDKARDFFSDYAEGTLDAGLKLSFERAMQNDPGLAAEFAQFQGVLKSLEGSANEPVETPMGLHDKIMAKIDKAEWEAKQKRPAGSWGSLRLAIFGGAAVIALVGAVMALLPGGTQGLASIFGGQGGGNETRPVEVKKDHAPTLEFSDSEFRILRDSGSDVSYSITRVADGEVISEGQTADREMKLPVVNEDNMARLVEIKVGQATRLVALPGRAPSPSREGRGSVRDFALALADTLKTPVDIDTTSKETVSWSITGSDAQSVSVSPSVVTVQWSESGTLVVGN